MQTTSLRRLAVAAVAVMGVAAAASPAAHAEEIMTKTTVSVASPYDPSALLDQRTIDEGKGPVFLKVRREIRCIYGKERRAGYGKMCYWSSAIGGGTATVSTVQGHGDLYHAGGSVYPLGTTFHAGYMRQGATVVDEWPIIVRGDNLREADETFKLSTSVTGGNTTFSTFMIRDDERRQTIRTSPNAIRIMRDISR